MIFKAFTLTVASVIVTGCKPAGQGSSAVKTLDNFAAGNRVTTNACIGPKEVLKMPPVSAMNDEIENKRIIWDTSGNKQQISLALQNAFSAVPPSIQTQFLATQGQFVVSKMANALCTERKKEFLKDSGRSTAELNSLQEGLSSVKACYLYAMPEEASIILGRNIAAPSFFVVMADDPSEIQHNLVRVFGYMNAQISSRMYVKGDFTSADSSYAFAEQENPDFSAKRKKVADAFLEDLKKLGKHASFSRYETDSDLVARSYFEDFVYAEAFDSYFCSANTLKAMGRDFPMTLSAFAETWATERNSFALAGDDPSFSLWGNPFTWASNKWSGYTQQRDAIIQKMTADTMMVNNRQPPSMLQTVSIAANGAWRPLTNAPLVSKFVRPAVNAADAIGGATVSFDANGRANTRALSPGERYARGGAAVADVAVGQAAGYLGKRYSAAAGDRAEALMRRIPQFGPGIRREIVQGSAYFIGQQVTEQGLGFGASQVGGRVSGAANRQP